MFAKITQTVKDALYESASYDFDFDENGDEILVLAYDRQDVERIADLMAKDMNGDLKENINYKEEMNKADVAKKFDFENSDVQSNEATNKQKARKQ